MDDGDDAEDNRQRRAHNKQKAVVPNLEQDSMEMTVEMKAALKEKDEKTARMVEELMAQNGGLGSARHKDDHSAPGEKAVARPLPPSAEQHWGQGSQSAPRQPQPVQHNPLLSIQKEALFARLKSESQLSEEQVPRELDFFLTDASEGISDASAVYLFGQAVVDGQFVSTCVEVPNQIRELFVMPRSGFTFEQVVEEVQQKLTKGKGQSKAKGAGKEVRFERAVRSYCFEQDVDYRNQPVECVRAVFDHGAYFPSKMWPVGRTFKGVFGTSYTPLELFFLRNRVYGPGWLRLSHFEVAPKRSFSDVPLLLRVRDEQQSISTKSSQTEVPPMTVMVLQLRKDESQANQLLAAHVSVYTGFRVSDSLFESADHILVHKDLKHELPASGPRVHYSQVNAGSDLVMVRTLFQLFGRVNPDLIVGHEMFTGVLDVLFAKLKLLGQELSFMAGRLLAERDRFKTLGGNNLAKRARLVFSGRLLVDTFTLAKEFIKLDDYSIESIMGHVRGGSVLVPSGVDAGFRANADFMLEILNRQQFLPLTLQLSQVAGCLWSVSLRQARAERNEVLLMHKFHEQGFLLPDRKSFEREDKGGKGYSGGKVLDPVTGFYDTYVVLVDFNSLYPSIIRHYNICFTTVLRRFRDWEGQPEDAAREAHSEDDNSRADLEDDGQQDDLVLVKPMNSIVVSPDQKPLLPSVLSMLVNERKRVKNELKRADSKDKRLQLEAKQLAFKLIANSIYGCLGFVFSRFYCKTMASLITHFGRHLLVSSEQLIRGLGLDVIYGDTDSLMVNTKAANPFDAIAVGLKIKREVNGQFRRGKDQGEQMLEVELDGVFKKLLLTKKKKYAALKLVNFMDIAQSSMQVEEKLRLEIKGLDMVRRDWSKLTREVSMVVLTHVMESGDLEPIYEYLGLVSDRMDQFYLDEVGQAARKGLKVTHVPRTLRLEQERGADELENSNPNTPQPPCPSGDAVAKRPAAEAVAGTRAQAAELRLSDFVIKRQLNKKVEDYHSTDQMPHVRVAQWMIREKGKSSQELVNHYIPFVMTSRGSTQGEQAMAIEEYDGQLNSKDGVFHPIDVDFYKNNQLLNPIQRLLESLEGFVEHDLKSSLNIVSLHEQQQKVQECVTELNSKVHEVKRSLLFFYQSEPINHEDYRLKCIHCDSLCYAFSVGCSVRKDRLYSINNYRNRLTKVLKGIVDQFWLNSRKCPICPYATNQVTSDEPKCPVHGKVLKLTITAKFANAKILYFRKLCEGFAKNNADAIPQLSVIHDLFDKFDSINRYNNNSFLQIFSPSNLVCRKYDFLNPEKEFRLF